MTALHPARVFLRPSLLRDGRRGPIGLGWSALLLATVVIAAACAPTVKPGGTVLVDNFDTPMASGLPDDPPRGEGYVDGEYMIKLAAGSRGSDRVVELSPVFVNVTVTVEARLVGPTDEGALGVARGVRSPSQYVLIVSPRDGLAVLFRNQEHGSSTVALKPSPALRRGNAGYHLELTCAGTRITGRVNDIEIGPVHDTFYKGGRIGLYVGGRSQSVEARFDNLVVREVIVEP